MPHQPDMMQGDYPSFARLAHAACRFALDCFSQGDAFGAREWLELSLLWLELQDKERCRNAPPA